MAKKKVEKDKQRSTKHSHKTKDWVTRTPLINGMNSGAPEGMKYACFFLSVSQLDYVEKLEPY